MLVLHEVPTEVTENFKEFCIRFLFALLCCFSFPKTSSNFLPMLRDETSLQSLEMHQLISEAYVVCNISTERKNSDKTCLHKGSTPAPQKEFYSCHTHLSISARKHCSGVYKQQNFPSSRGVPLVPLHNKCPEFRDLFITPAAIHTNLKGASAKGTSGHGVEVLTISGFNALPHPTCDWSSFISLTMEETCSLIEFNLEGL